MQHLSTIRTKKLLRFARRGALLLALGAAGPGAWGQSFGPATTYAAGPNSYPVNVALGDINADGRPDIVTANSGSNTVGVMLALAAGGFAPVATYATETYPVGVAVGDVNGDGRLDIVTSHSTANKIAVLFGQAGGGFGSMNSYATGSNSGPFDVALGDMNGDGRLDIVTANSSGAAGVLLGIAGGFGPATAYSTGTNAAGANNIPEQVILGDVNSDGHLDIITANATANSVTVLLGQAGGFGPALTYSTGQDSSPFSVALGDVNADGRPDIVATISTSSPPYGGAVVVLTGLPGGGFGPFTLYSAISHPGSVRLGDVNGDNRLDIITTTQQYSSVEIFLNQGNGFAAPMLRGFMPGALPMGMAVGDLNGDGRLDIVTANGGNNPVGGFGGNNTVGVLLNTGTFTPLATARPTADDLTLAPNPAHDAFTVTLPAGPAPGPAVLLNPLGQVVRRLTPAGPRFTVETAGLIPGIYLLRMGLGAAAVARRVVVE